MILIIHKYPNLLTQILFLNPNSQIFKFLKINHDEKAYSVKLPF